MSRATVTRARLGCGAREGGRGSRIEAEAGSLSDMMLLQGFLNISHFPNCWFSCIYIICYELMTWNVSDSKTSAWLCCEGCPDIIGIIPTFHIQSIHLEPDRNCSGTYMQGLIMNLPQWMHGGFVYLICILQNRPHNSIYLFHFYLCYCLYTFASHFHLQYTVRLGCPNLTWMDDFVIALSLFLLKV